MWSCEVKNPAIQKERIKWIKAENYKFSLGSTPTLLFSTLSFSEDTNFFWLFNVVVPDTVLNEINEKSLEFKANLNLEDSSFKNWFSMDVYYANTNKVESIKLPMAKGLNYIDLLIKILEENKVKDLDIAVKKLNYMKD